MVSRIARYNILSEGIFHVADTASKKNRILSIPLKLAHRLCQSVDLLLDRFLLIHIPRLAWSYFLVVYRSKDNRQEKTFLALDWLAAMASHIPIQGEQMVRYYGFYSNASRGHRQKENADALIPCVIEPDERARPNRNWARLIQKIYEVNPLTCPQCQGLMRIISIIEDSDDLTTFEYFKPLFSERSL